MANAKNLFFLSFLSLLGVFLVWLPFFLGSQEFWGIKLPSGGMQTIFANFDGPYYIVAAKSLYDPIYIEQNFSFPKPSIYYSAHYPLFPLLIRGVATAIPMISYPYAMIAVTLICGVLATLMFYFLLLEIGLGKNALFLSSLFTVLPARWLIVRSIGSPEPLFIFLIIAFIYFVIKKKWWTAALFGVLAQLTKPPGILLFISFLIMVLWQYWADFAHTNFSTWFRRLPWKAYPLTLIPLSLLGLFLFYGKQYGNFFAYFNSGDNIHLMFPPFQVFNPEQPWVGTFWLEEVIWIYLFGLVGVLYLIKQKYYAIASFTVVFLLTIFFVSHRDIARYSLPVVAFLIIAFNKLLSSLEFRWIMVVLLIPIYLFSLVFISGNITPIGDWGPLL